MATRKLIPDNPSDAFLVKGYYDNDPDIKEALGEILSKYYFNKYYGLFRVNKETAEEIFQMSAKALLVNIKTRRIYVNDDGELIGTDGQPFRGKLTTYFMSIAENMYKEMERGKRRNQNGKQPPKDIPEPPVTPWSGMSFPYEKYEREEGEKHGHWYWYINGKSTGIEVRDDEPESKLTKQMPYIGIDLHWWIGSGDKAKDLGSLFNDILYDDEQITTLSIIARRIVQMNCMCKQILTFSLFLGKSNDEIATIKGYKDSTVVKAKKHDCLEKLRNYANSAVC